jgi:hypothetical protein
MQICEPGDRGHIAAIVAPSPKRLGELVHEASHMVSFLYNFYFKHFSIRQILSASHTRVYILSRPSRGVTYKDVVSDWKLNLFASHTITTNYNYLNSFMQQHCTWTCTGSWTWIALGQTEAWNSTLLRPCVSSVSLEPNLELKLNLVLSLELNPPGSTSELTLEVSELLSSWNLAILNSLLFLNQTSCSS